MDDRRVLELFGSRILAGDIKDPTLVKLVREEIGATISRHAARRIIRLAKTGGIEEEEEEGEEIVPLDRGWGDDYDFNPVTRRYLTKVSCAPGGLIVTTEDEHKAIKSAYSNWDGDQATLNQIAARFRMPRRYLVEYLRRHGVTHDSEPFTREEVMSRPIEEMAEEVYQGRRHKLHQASERVKWKRFTEAAEKWFRLDDSILTRFEEKLGEGAKRVPRLEMRESERPFALFVSLQDLHLGMYSEAGYDMAEAERRAVTCLQDILDRLPGRPEVIHFTIGGDVTHADGLRAATTKGTPLDTDGNPGEHLERVVDLMVMVIDLLRQIARVVGHPVPGNHGRANDLATQLYLFAWYRKADDVEIRRSRAERTYFEYGATTIGMCHGDGVKPSELGPLMAVEAREAWGRTRHHVWFTGHLHHLTAQEIGGITHYLLPSLTEPDRWHRHHGFVTGEPSMMAFLVDAEDGVVSWLRSVVRKEAA